MLFIAFIHSHKNVTRNQGIKHRKITATACLAEKRKPRSTWINATFELLKPKRNSEEKVEKEWRKTLNIKEKTNERKEKVGKSIQTHYV
jgi:hypothetical protein